MNQSIWFRLIGNIIFIRLMIWLFNGYEIFLKSNDLAIRTLLFKNISISKWARTFMDLNYGLEILWIIFIGGLVRNRGAFFFSFFFFFFFFFNGPIIRRILLKGVSWNELGQGVVLLGLDHRLAVFDDYGRWWGWWGNFDDGAVGFFVNDNDDLLFHFYQNNYT